ncbi:MAG: hypothetical protein ACK4VZ_15220 [Paracoccaceae bacterium]
MAREQKGALIGEADVVKISPLFEVKGTTAYMDASVTFELLCVMSEAVGAPS